MLALFAQFPSWIDPYVIPGLPIRWYAVMYLVAFGIAYALFGHLLFQTIGMKLEVLFRSPCKQLIQTDPEGIMLGIGGKRNA